MLASIIKKFILLQAYKVMLSFNYSFCHVFKTDIIGRKKSFRSLEY